MKKSKRELWKLLEDMNDTDDPTELNVTSEVVRYSEKEDRQSEPPDGWKELETQSPVVTIYQREA